MKKLVPIIAGEPKSINAEIIAKTWKQTKNKLLIIGDYKILKKQLINFKVNLSNINIITDLKYATNKLNILNVKKKNIQSSQYIFDCLKTAVDLIKKKKIKGFINAPINKKILNKKYPGITEYLAANDKVLGREIMMIYNNKLSVVPLTTHIPIKLVHQKITFNLIKNKIFYLSNYYKKLFKKKPKIAVLGLNPHNDENKKNSTEKKIITPAIKKLKKLKIRVNGPFSADTAFNKINRNKFDIIVGMYHDQILAPFKALYEFNAVNITLGLSYLRISPDHGTAENIIGKNIANPQSMMLAVNLFNKFNV